MVLACEELLVTTPSTPITPWRQPAEWTLHEACWTAWPHLAKEWGEHLGPARAELVALCGAIVDPDPRTGAARGEAVRVLVRDESGEASARKAFAGVPVTFHRTAFWDIWLRDTGPIFVEDARGRIVALCCAFNGWGGKFMGPEDQGLATRVAGMAGVPSIDFGFVLEGGAVEVDGEGTCLTTRQCMLNPNRNGPVNEALAEARLRAALGVEQVIWLDDGLRNDHTDGHVDTLARFVAPGVVVCMEAQHSDDPNRDALVRVVARLSERRDAQGRKLEVVRIPSPGRVMGDTGDVLPASYTNFYVGNRVVAVPTYGTRWDEEAVQGLAPWFPGRETVGLSARAILTGGGAFHCITQQQPQGPPIPEERS